jgi:hypothetical protein
MGEDKDVILIMIGLFVLFGLAYGPIKNSVNNQTGQRQNIFGSSLITTPTTSQGDTSNNAGNTNISQRDVAQNIQEIERSIEKIEQDLEKKIEESKRSPYYGKIRMSNVVNLNNTDPNREYIRLSTYLGEKETLKVTGWYLKSEKTGNFATIGKATMLPFPFTKNDTDIILKSNDSLTINKGFSPIGVSFRTNICTGYFEENRTFTPSLPMQCPRPVDEDLPNFSSIPERDDECADIIKRIPICTTVGNEFIRELPDTVTNSCKAYLQTNINYNSCVAKHFGDTKFPGNEYRVYLNTFRQLWKKDREKINLHDENGLIVDTISYGL